MGRTDEKFRRYWRHYLIQSVFAALVIFIVLLFLSVEKTPVIIASIGATAFIVFAMPDNITAQPRNIIGGHSVGVISGTLCALIPHSSSYHSILIYSLAVGLSIFLMVLIDTEHPPASGTALSVAITGFSVSVAIGVMTSAVLLSLIHHLFKPHLRDLT